MDFKSSHWSCLKARFKDYAFFFFFYNIFGQTIYWSTAKPWTSLKKQKTKKRSNDLERSKFRQQVQSFVCVHPWRRVTFKFAEMLKNSSWKSLVPTNIFSLKIFNFVQSFVECKVSLADGSTLILALVFCLYGAHHFIHERFECRKRCGRKWRCPKLAVYGVPYDYRIGACHQEVLRNNP
jgi:hypothetical protein